MAVCSGGRDTGYIHRSWVSVPGQVIGTGTSSDCSWGPMGRGRGAYAGGEGRCLGEGGGYGAGVGDHGGKYRGASRSLGDDTGKGRGEVTGFEREWIRVGD